MAKRHHSSLSAPHLSKMHASHPLHTSQMESHIHDHEYDATGLAKGCFIKPLKVVQAEFNHHYGSSTASEYDEQMRADVDRLMVKPGKKI